MTEECEHDKVYGPPTMLLCDPPIRRTPWICRTCMMVGYDDEQERRANQYDEFDELHQRRRAEGIE